jgi:hypothetical protein
VGDFSRSTFDRLKHYVGVRLQQGVPLVDADWNELEDIRRYEVQAFLKWFVGDGVPAGNDGFRIAGVAGGGVNTIRLASPATTPGRSTVSVDVSASTAAAALGFTAANRQAFRALAPARLTGDATQPFALAAGMTLVVSVDGAAPQTVTFAAAGFATIAAATAAEVVAAVNTAANRVVASAGIGDDFVIVGGDGTPDGAGRCLVDGRDAVHEGRLNYSSQQLFANPALATAWDVPVVAELTAPSSGTRADLVYLDVWEREVTVAEDETLVDQLINVETCVRLKREWAVRVRPGSGQVPVSGDADFRAGHGYLPLAQLNRQAGVTTLLPATLADLRPRNLLMPPATLVEDVIGVNASDYRRGLNRPQTNLRDAINALLAGRLPVVDDLAVSPGPGADVLQRASVVDGTGALNAIWHAPRGAGTSNQIVTARFDPAGGSGKFGAASVITSGVAHLEPSAVLLPTGEILVAYQADSGTNADIVMKRGLPNALAGAAEQPVATTAGAADQGVRAVLVNDQVVFFAFQATLKQWQFRRYHHTDNTFLDSSMQNLSAANLGPQELHAASAGGVVWVAWSEGNKLQAARLSPGTAAPPSPAVVDLTTNVPLPTPNTATVFVLAIDATNAMVFYAEGTGLWMLPCVAGVWAGAPTKVTDTDGSDSQPSAVRDADGTVYLVATRVISGNDTDIVLRRRNAVTGQWGQSQRMSPNPANDQRPHPLFAPGQGIWVLWMRTVAAPDAEIFAKRIITAI